MNMNTENTVSYLPASTRCIMIPELLWKIFEQVNVFDPFVVSTARRFSEFEWVMDSLR